MTYFQRLIINTLAFISLSVLFPSMFYVNSFMMAIVASIVLSALNVLVKPILHILSLPITLITFGLFSFVINGVMLKFTSVIVGEQNFAFSSLGAAVFISLLLSLINSIIANRQVDRY